MLKSDIRYILKRVIAAILIAMIIFFLKSNNVLALSWDLSDEKEVVFPYNTAPKTCGVSLTNADATSNGQHVLNCTFNTNWTNSNNHAFAVIPFSFEASYYYLNTNASSMVYSPLGSTYRVAMISTDSNWSACEIQNNFIVCPLHNGTTYTNLRFYFTTQSTTGLIRYYTWNINNAFSLYDSNSMNTASAIDSINNSIQQATQDQMDNSSVTTSDVDVSQMSGVQGILPAGPVDSLLSLPLTLINLLISGTSGSCTPFTFTFVFDETFTLPCFDTFWNQVPSSMMIFLSDLPAVYIFIKWAKSIYSRVERAVSFESSVDDEWGGV